MDPPSVLSRSGSKERGDNVGSKRPSKTSLMNPTQPKRDEQSSGSRRPSAVPDFSRGSKEKKASEDAVLGKMIKASGEISDAILPFG
jgi:hypothetical protein